MNITWATACIVGTLAAHTNASEPVTPKAVENAISDYVLSKYAGDDEGVRARVHHDISRRAIAETYWGRPSEQWVRPYSSDVLQFYGTRLNETRRDDPENGRLDITVFDVQATSAAAVVVMEDVVDFLHMTHFDGRWVIADSSVIILDKPGDEPPAPSRTEEAAVRKVIRDYCVGFYETDGAKVQSTCHPILSKRTVARWPEADAFNYFSRITWEEIRILGNTYNRHYNFDPATSRCDIEIYEIRGGIALAKLTGENWFDYMQLMKVNGQWTIVNIIYEPLPDEPDDHASAIEWGERIQWADNGPSAREHASVMTFGDRVVVYAGSGYQPQGQPLDDAWAYDTRTHDWTPLAIEGDLPTPGGSKRVAHDPDTSRVYIFGGYGQGFAPSNELFRASLKGDTLTFTRVEQLNTPPARALHAFAYDPQAKRFITALGVAPGAFYDDAWVGEFDDQGRVAWHEAESGPTARFGFSFGFDADSGDLLILSGQLPPTRDNPMAMTDELWTINARAEHASWTFIDLPDPPEGRRNPTFAFDDRNSRLVAWCGTADGRNNIEDIVVVHHNDNGNNAWTATRIPDNGTLPKRSSGFGFVDPATGRLYLGFGNSIEGRFQDWVTLDPMPEDEG